MKDSIFESYKLLMYTEKDKGSFEEFLGELPKEYEGIIFKKLEKDSIGRSGGNPTWVKAYHYKKGVLNNSKVALYKEYDYDEPRASYAEKLWSILGKTVLEGVRVPDIDMVYKKDKGCLETISYRVLDNSTEDLSLMSTVLDAEFWESKKQMRDCCMIEELLSAIKNYINKSKNNTNKNENYKKLEKEIIYTILLDAISNNGDRHPNNWGIVENKISGDFELALFDHSNTFRNLINQYTGLQSNRWMLTYLKTDPNYRNYKLLTGDSAERVIEYIKTKYQEYFSDFTDLLKERLPDFFSQIEKEKILEDELLKVRRDLYSKEKFLERILERGEIYEN